MHKIVGFGVDIKKSDACSEDTRKDENTFDFDMSSVLT
jgi:hypothetical protein